MGGSAIHRLIGCNINFQETYSIDNTEEQWGVASRPVFELLSGTFFEINVGNLFENRFSVILVEHADSDRCHIENIPEITCGRLFGANQLPESLATGGHQSQAWFRRKLPKLIPKIAGQSSRR